MPIILQIDYISPLQQFKRHEPRTPTVNNSTTHTEPVLGSGCIRYLHNLLSRDFRLWAPSSRLQAAISCCRPFYEKFHIPFSSVETRERDNDCRPGWRDLIRPVNKTGLDHIDRNRGQRGTLKVLTQTIGCSACLKQFSLKFNAGEPKCSGTWAGASYR